MRGRHQLPMFDLTTIVERTRRLVEEAEATGALGLAAQTLSTFYRHSCPQMGPNEATQSDLTLRVLCWCGIFPSSGSRTDFQA